MEKEKQLLLLCCRLIEQSLNWGDSDIWTNDDFEQLSKLIFEKTRVQLSVSTLKRIWGKVKYNSFPTAATLNALAGYLDYTSWRDFRQQYQVNGVMITEPIAPPVAETVETMPPAKKSFRYVWLALGLLIAISSIYFISIKRKTAPDLSTVKFETKKITDDLPNSVVFNYDASTFKSDSVFIQQNWDPSRREQVPGDGKQFTSIYYHPGFFNAKLIVDNQVKKEAVIFIKTKGWKGIIDKSPVPVYLSAHEIKTTGGMGISGELMQQKLGLSVFNDNWVKFSNVREFPGIKADDFTLDCTLRNSSTAGQSICGKLDLTILGTGTAIIIPLVNKGCIADMGILNVGDWIGGKDHDLSAFGCDVSQFQNLTCTVKDRHLKIYLNKKQIYDVAQNHPMGHIIGIRFEFEGPGEVKHYKLETPGATVYEESF
ncbi:hypothetical protein [Mucilaginibacter dorajii]|uniref:PKD domain-containing protein n=1 Tax=Mucilaginibacter dorajii TaxID=692994 RepID=A0ABP7P272_9SPHI|nr:hypothetical protein [Mucilaginibacter dorajii]MCS3737014.1 hypothetical protein [Mucilaginibacter dorajii]